MRPPKTAYALSESQVATPPEAVALFWKLANALRPRMGTVLDLGAGDCRFAVGGGFTRYTGVELDGRRVQNAKVPKDGRLIHTCAFKYRGADFDACIGNPPYVRHHDLESPWKEKTVTALEKQLGVKLDRHCNLFIYFMCLGLLKTKSDGLLGFVVPYEWTSRPSAAAVRNYIRENGWAVRVYRFQKPIFKGVLTTASITLIDKSVGDGRWRYFDIDKDYNVHARRGVTAGALLQHKSRGCMWALRGLSPGTQKVFTLTEDERVSFGLTLRDVRPCVTTMRGLPRQIKRLTKQVFKKRFVDAGKRCWLLKSYSPTLSQRLKRYLQDIPKSARNTYTCRNQFPWYKFTIPAVPHLLVGAGFTHFGPKVVVNSCGACAVGSVYGVHGTLTLPAAEIADYLSSVNVERRVVAHAKTLKKIEVRQLNSLLSSLEKTGAPS